MKKPTLNQMIFEYVKKSDNDKHCVPARQLYAALKAGPYRDRLVELGITGKDKFIQKLQADNNKACLPFRTRTFNDRDRGGCCLAACDFTETGILEFHNSQYRPRAWTGDRQKQIGESNLLIAVCKRQRGHFLHKDMEWINEHFDIELGFDKIEARTDISAEEKERLMDEHADRWADNGGNGGLTKSEREAEQERTKLPPELLADLSRTMEQLNRKLQAKADRDEAEEHYLNTRGNYNIRKAELFRQLSELVKIGRYAFWAVILVVVLNEAVYPFGRWLLKWLGV